jgi:anti-sigma factor RsiW
MTCPHTEKISSLIDGELPLAEASVLERHVAVCPECQQVRSDFLNLRSQIVSFNPAVDRVALRQALAATLSKVHPTSTGPVRAAGSFGFFGALRFGPAFVAIALLLITGVIGFLLYRNAPRQVANQPLPADRVVVEQKSGSAPTPATPAAAASPSPPSSDSNKEGAVKPNEGKRPGRKPRPPIDVPKVHRMSDDLISPWRNQAIAVNTTTEPVAVDNRAAGSESLTARHLGQSELLLRSFRNVRTAGVGLSADVDYERKRAQRLVYQNILLRREADAKGDVQVATLLDSLEPILLDIANLSDNPHDDDVRAIKERLRRKNLVALLQVNSTALARANE